MPKQKPTPIGGEGFRGKSALTQQDLERLIISAPAEASSLFNNWERGFGCAMICTLSNDNSKVINCSPKLFGDLYPNPRKRTVVAVNSAWEKLPSLHLSLGTIDGEIFDFRGGLTSALVDSSALDYQFLSNGNVLTEAECLEAGLLGFSIKAFLYPITQEHSRISLVLYPEPLTNLTADNPLATDHRFPGLRL